jgi:DNA (cytosine-5)-methyltransferase 1
MMAAYYNDNDPFVVAWLRELIKEGLIANGEVDDRNIENIPASDLRSFTQCHFFAGIGGWSYALRLAGWPDDCPVWTGSCPCQPLSSAGQRKGHADKRHVWPAFHRLISECAPSIVFGEQVAGPDGQEWYAGVRADLEASGYACGASDLPFGAFGALHKRHRLWWVGADASCVRLERRTFASFGSASILRYEEFERLAQDAVQSSVPTGRFGALIDGLPSRVGQVRGYGNSIVPQVAATFIQEALLAIDDLLPRS